MKNKHVINRIICRFVKSYYFLFFFALSFILASCYINPQVLRHDVGPLYGKKIMLDPGHGVKDTSGININPGVKGENGVEEQVVVVDIAERLGKKLEEQGCLVYYTRDKEHFWRIYDDVRGDNYNRSFEARDLNVDAFIKIHLDWDKRKNISGTRTFYFKRNSKKLAQAIHKALIKTINHTNRGIEREWFVGMEVAEMPTILVELCFISNPEACAALKDPSFLDACADGMYQGLLAYYTKH